MKSEQTNEASPQPGHGSHPQLDGALGYAASFVGGMTLALSIQLLIGCHNFNLRGFIVGLWLMWLPVLILYLRQRHSDELSRAVRES